MPDYQSNDQLIRNSTVPYTEVRIWGLDSGYRMSVY